MSLIYGYPEHFLGLRFREGEFIAMIALRTC